MTRAILFIISIGLVCALIYWFLSAKARRAAAYIKHKHDLDEIKTDKDIEQYRKIEKKAKK